MRKHVARVARPLRSHALGIALAVALLGGCQPPAPLLLPPDTLVVAVRNAPAAWQIGPEGRPHGFEHDLIVQFAAEHKLPLVTVPVVTATALTAKLTSGEVHMGLGGLYRSVEDAPLRTADGRSLPLAWTSGLRAVELVLIHGSEGFRPKRWDDLKGAAVSYIGSTGLDEEIGWLASVYPDIRFAAVDATSADALISRVSDGDVDFALVSSLSAAVARNVHLNFEVAFPVGTRLQIAWLVGMRNAKLKSQLDAFIAWQHASGAIERVAQRYHVPSNEVRRIDAGVFQDRIRKVLPAYRRLFHDAQEATGIEWRLLAAVAYQESQWEPLATSETGVRGFMQLTTETARHLGVNDRTQPRDSVVAAARYLRDLKARLPERIAEPDRTWLALAAFNIGLGHLEDARIIAQRHKLDPDAWQDVKQALPLLAVPEHYERAKLGYARGGMPVAFVDRVRGYYDILLRHEAAHGPRLRASGRGS